MAFRTRWQKNQAVLYWTPRSRASWFALIPFLELHIRWMA